MKNWVIKHKNVLGGALLYALFPLLCAVIWCLKEGHGIGDVYLPASYWNDEMMYFKQVEAVVNHGLPKGVFGYNEVAGKYCYFAVWSPVILIPWCIWGVLFGWEIISPVYANIVFCMIGLALFYLLVKPTKKQTAWILGMLAVFTPYTRYMLSGMPEALSMTLVIVFVGCAAAYMRKQRGGMLVVMFGIAFFLALSRPYMLLLFLLPAFFCVRKYKWRGGILSAVLILAAAVVYWAIIKCCCSTYIVPSLETGWIETFLTDGLGAGTRNFLTILAEKLSLLFTEYLKKGVKYGLFAGALYGVAGLLAFLVALQLIMGYLKKEKSEYRVLYIYYVISVVGMFFAIFLLYKMGEGAKHLMSFVVMGFLLLSLMEKRALVGKLLVVAACGYFFIVKMYAPFDWQVAFDDGTLKAEAERLEKQVDGQMVLSKTEEPYENTIIWLASDMIDGESVTATWGLLYVMPDGFGINFCTQAYVMEHFESLQSKYIAVLPGGEVEDRLLLGGYTCVAATERMAVYERMER